MQYIKHLIKCRCTLPQFKYLNPPVMHSFVVFSALDSSGEVEPSFAQCNNCGIVHKITEVGVSNITRKEDISSIVTIDEIKSSIPENLVKLLTPYELPLATWQEIQFILDNELWTKNSISPIVLTKESVDGVTTGKCLIIVGRELYKINSFTQEEFVNGK